MVEKSPHGEPVMATNNIFVYNAGDRENQMLAALVRFCDQAERKFSFLSVTSAESVARMHKFLSQHGITPDSVRLPFVIVVGPHGRTVMHGDPIHHWLGGLVAALVQSDMTSPELVREHVVASYLAPYTMSLVAYAAGGPALQPAASVPAPPANNPAPTAAAANAPPAGETAVDVTARQQVSMETHIADDDAVFIDDASTRARRPTWLDRSDWRWVDGRVVPPPAHPYGNNSALPPPSSPPFH
jgi:hypothetical protein